MGTNVLEHVTTDALEQQLVALEGVVSQVRARQVILLREADRRQIPTADGCRSLQEWTAARLDLAADTAKQLVATTRLLADQPDLEISLSDGDASFDRILATGRLTASGASDSTLLMSTGFDISGVNRQTALHRRMTPGDERQIFEDRFVAMQPTLDRSSFRLWGQLPGIDGELVEQALLTRADQFPTTPDETRGSRGQRNADALVSISQDSLATSSSELTTAGPVLSVFTNSDLAASSDGGAGSTTSSGISIGAQAIEEILCGGSLEHTVISDGVPIALGRATSVIPPRMRRFVLWRDGGCGADGCQSRYRLQPHHRIPWSKGGRTDPDNLVTLCWFHHHVVIHGMGYQIKPDSPPQRLRFAPHGSGPP